MSCRNAIIHKRNWRSGKCGAKEDFIFMDLNIIDSKEIKRNIASRGQLNKITHKKEVVNGGNLSHTGDANREIRTSNNL